MLIEIIATGVTAGNKILPVGEQVETDKASAESLFDSGHAKPVAAAVAKNASESPTGLSKSVDDRIPAQGGDTGEGKGTGDTGEANNANGGQGENGTENPGQVNGQAGTGGAQGRVQTDSDVEKTRQALDDQYKRDELYEAAKKAGVEIAYDAKKGEIIDAAIAQGKAAAMLK